MNKRKNRDKYFIWMGDDIEFIRRGKRRKEKALDPLDSELDWTLDAKQDVEEAANEIRRKAKEKDSEEETCRKEGKEAPQKEEKGPC